MASEQIPVITVAECLNLAMATFLGFVLIAFVVLAG